MNGDDVYIGDEEGDPKLECAIAWHQYAKEIKTTTKIKSQIYVSGSILQCNKDLSV